MTWKQLDAQLSKWLFEFVAAPLVLVAPYLRTNYWLHGDIFTFKKPLRGAVSLSKKPCKTLEHEENHKNTLGRLWAMTQTGIPVRKSTNETHR